MPAGAWIERRGWVRPDHGGACFSSLPGTIAELLGAGPLGPSLPAELLAPLQQRYERVVLVYLDAFSWELARRHERHPLLARASAQGVLAPITSQFPSTTAAHITTIQTGLAVGEHGVYEWYVLEPSLERLIAPLPYTYAGDGGAPLGAELPPERVYPATTIYERLGEHGVRSAVAGPWMLARTTTSAALLRGATRTVGFRDVESGLAELARELAALEPPAYGFLYIEALDSLLHRVGPLEPARTHVEHETVRLLDAIERGLLARAPAGTLLLLSSDHGMAPVSPRETIYVNEGEGAEAIVDCVRIGADPDGHPLAPAGSCRDLFLHAKPGRGEELAAALRAKLGERAEVRLAQELIDAGLFGERPSAALRARLGDVAVLPELGAAAYWYTPGRFRQMLWGQHGGLTPQEMEVPLLALAAP